MTGGELCENCVSGFVIPGTPKGTVEKIGPYDAYVAKPSGNIVKSDVALIFFYDAFGLGLQNNKVLADRFAERLGITVYEPDMFEGGGVAESAIGAMPTTAKDARAQTFMQKVSAGVKMSAMAPWLLSNRPSSKYAKISAFLQALRTEKGINKMAGVGYCYGGGIALQFNTTGDLAASVLCHPSLINMSMIKGIKAPCSFALAEVDNMVSEKFAKEIEDYLTTERKDVDSEFKTYPNTVHGFAARPNLADPQVKAGFEGAFKQTVDFVRKHLQIEAAS